MALNINRHIVNLAEEGLKYSKCSTFKAAWVCGQSYASISHNPTSVYNLLNTHFAGPLQLKVFNFSYLFLRQ